MSSPTVRTGPPPRRRPEGRYDAPSRLAQRSTALLLSVLFVALLASIAFALYARYATRDVDVQERGFSVVSDDEVRVDFAVSAPAGSTAWCLVRARGADGAEVGAVYVPVPGAGGDEPRAATHRLATTARAVTGEVPRCTTARPPAGTPTAQPRP